MVKGTFEVPLDNGKVMSNTVSYRKTRTSHARRRVMELFSL